MQSNFIDRVINIEDYLTDEPQRIDAIAEIVGIGVGDTAYLLALAALRGYAFEIYSSSYVRGHNLTTRCTRLG